MGDDDAEAVGAEEVELRRFSYYELFVAARGVARDDERRCGDRWRHEEARRCFPHRWQRRLH